MLIIGLTGGSGAGKGEVCRAFFDVGIESIDTDKIYREVTAKGGDCLRELAENFTVAVIDENGGLDRKKLAEIVFSSAQSLELLNKITHKHILERCGVILTDKQKAGHKAVIIDAPQLFESGFDKNCGVIISVVAARDKRIARIRARDNITAEQAEIRINNQKSDEFFVEHSDYVIYNDSDLGNVCRQVMEIAVELL
jgi:dephospho-CoA kinase